MLVVNGDVIKIASRSVTCHRCEEVITFCADCLSNRQDERLYSWLSQSHREPCSKKERNRTMNATVNITFNNLTVDQAEELLKVGRPIAVATGTNATTAVKLEKPAEKTTPKAEEKPAPKASAKGKTAPAPEPEPEEEDEDETDEDEDDDTEEEEAPPARKGPPPPKVDASKVKVTPAALPKVGASKAKPKPAPEPEPEDEDEEVEEDEEEAPPPKKAAASKPAPKAKAKPAADEDEEELPDELVNARKIRDVVEWLMDAKDMTDVDDIKAECIRLRDRVPVLQRAGDDLEQRLERTLEVIDMGEAQT